MGGTIASVNFAFDGKTRTFKIEDGVTFSSDGKEYTVKNGKVYDDKNNPVSKPIPSNAATVGVYQGLSQLVNEGDIPRGERESVISKRDLAAAKELLHEDGGFEKLQQKMNNQTGRLNSTQKVLKDLKTGESGAKFDSENLLHVITVDPSNQKNKTDIRISTGKQEVKGKEKEENVPWYESPFVQKVRNSVYKFFRAD